MESLQYILCILQNSAVIIVGYVAFYLLRLFRTDPVKFYTDKLKISNNIHYCAVTLNIKEYNSFYTKIFYKYP